MKLEDKKLTEAERVLLEAVSEGGFYKPLEAYTERYDNNGELKSVKWAQNDTGLLGQFWVALNALYPNSRYFVSASGVLYVYGEDEASDATQWTAKNFEKHRCSVVDLNGYIQARWGGSFVNIKQLNSVLTDIVAKDKRFAVKPFLKAVELRAEEIKTGKKPRVEMQTFNDLFKSENEAPYQQWAYELMIKSPLVAQMGKGYSETMIILAGSQGIGKSHLVNQLSLGYSTQIKDVAQTNQETLLIRAENVFLESAELANMKRSDVESIKAAITTHRQDFLPKYSNERQSLDLPAVLIGSTNQYSILKDLTGERRFLPLAIDEISHDYDKDLFLSIYATYYIDMLDSQDFSLYKPETVQDLDFKRETFANVDAKVIAVEKWLNAHLQEYKLSQDESFVYLYKKAIIESDFAQETEDSSSCVFGIYPAKMYEVLSSKGAKTSTKRIEGNKVRVLKMPLEAYEELVPSEVGALTSF